MHRIAFSRITLILVVAGIMSVGLASCGGGGDGGGGRNGTVVLPPGNRAPVVARMIVPGTSTIVLTLDAGNPTRARWLTPQGLDHYFSDPDGDTLGYSVRSSDPGVAEPRVAVLLDDEKRVAVQGFRRGTATITVTARDPGSRSVSQSFRVRVDDRRSTPPTNRAPVIRTRFQDLTHTVSSLDDQRRTWTFNLASYFSDPDGDTLTYTARTTNVFFAAVWVTGNQLNVRSGVDGVATITVTATDPGGLTASQSFRLTTTFSNPTPPPSADRWGAIAVGNLFPNCQSRGFGTAWGYSNRDDAINQALSNCRSRSSHGCSRSDVLAWRNGCGALAEGRGCAWHASGRSTRSAAEQAALAGCRQRTTGCSIKVYTCTGNTQ